MKIATRMLMTKMMRRKRNENLDSKLSGSHRISSNYKFNDLRTLCFESGRQSMFEEPSKVCSPEII